MPDKTTHTHCDLCNYACVGVLSLIVAVMVFLAVGLWVEHQTISRNTDRIATLEAKFDTAQAQNSADAIAARTLVLELFTDPLPPVEKVEQSVREATANRKLSPVFIDLLDDLRRKAAAQRADRDRAGTGGKAGKKAGAH